MAERRLIDAPPQKDEPELTAHLRRVAAPVPLDAAARARIAAALRAARPERRHATAWLALGGALAATALLLVVLLGARRRGEPERVALPTSPTTPGAHAERMTDRPAALAVERETALANAPLKREADAPAPLAVEREVEAPAPLAVERETALANAPLKREADAPARLAVEREAAPANAPLKRTSDKPLWLSEGTMVVRAGNRARSVDTPLGKLTVRQGSVVEIKVRASRVQVAAWQGSALFNDGARTVEIAGGVAWSSDSAQALELLSQAIAKLRRAHDPEAALGLLARYRQLSDGELSHEAGLLEAEALLAAGRDEQALRALEWLSLEGRADLSAARDRLRKKLSGPEAP